MSDVSKKAKNICETNDSFIIWAKSHIAHFPADAEYLNAASVEVNHEDAEPEIIPVDEIQASFSPKKNNPEELISSDTVRLLRHSVSQFWLVASKVMN